MKGEKECPININDLSVQSAVSFVKKCEDLTTEDLTKSLSMYIAQLENFAKFGDLSSTKMFVHMVQKGFKHLCEKEKAIKYYYLGYCNRQQDELIQKSAQYYVRDKIKQISQLKHFESILRYLYDKGISRQSIVALQLKIDKSNLSRTMESLIDCDLVSKTMGPKCVFYELTSQGYAYCRENGIGDYKSRKKIRTYLYRPEEVSDMLTEFVVEQEQDYEPFLKCDEDEEEMRFRVSSREIFNFQSEEDHNGTDPALGKYTLLSVVRNLNE